MSDAAPAPLHLFAGYGVEIEYAIVDRRTLAVMPVADEVLLALGIVVAVAATARRRARPLLGAGSSS